MFTKQWSILSVYRQCLQNFVVYCLYHFWLTEQWYYHRLYQKCLQNNEIYCLYTDNVYKTLKYIACIRHIYWYNDNILSVSEMFVKQWSILSVYRQYLQNIEVYCLYHTCLLIQWQIYCHCIVEHVWYKTMIVSLSVSEMSDTDNKRHGFVYISDTDNIQKCLQNNVTTLPVSEMLTIQWSIIVCIRNVYKTMKYIVCIRNVYRTMKYTACIRNIYKTMVYIVCIQTMFTKHWSILSVSDMFTDQWQYILQYQKCSGKYFCIMSVSDMFTKHCFVNIVRITNVYKILKSYVSVSQISDTEQWSILSCIL